MCTATLFRPGTRNGSTLPRQVGNGVVDAFVHAVEQCLS